VDDPSTGGGVLQTRVDLERVVDGFGFRRERNRRFPFDLSA
jgi:hypothetical protein